MLKALWQFFVSLFRSQKNPEKTHEENNKKDDKISEEKTVYKFSEKSKEKLETCHPDIQKLFNEVIKYVDCTIIEGVRTKKQQEEYVRTGRSETMNSKHLQQEDGYSHAVDVMVYPIDWDDWKRNSMFVGYVLGVASQMGIEIRSGIDWDSDFNISEHSFLDAPHFELKK